MDRPLRQRRTHAIEVAAEPQNGGVGQIDLRRRYAAHLADGRQHRRDRVESIEQRPQTGVVPPERGQLTRMRVERRAERARGLDRGVELRMELADLRRPAAAERIVLPLELAADPLDGRHITAAARIVGAGAQRGNERRIRSSRFHFLGQHGRQRVADVVVVHARGRLRRAAQDIDALGPDVGHSGRRQRQRHRLAQGRRREERLERRRPRHELERHRWLANRNTQFGDDGLEQTRQLVDVGRAVLMVFIRPGEQLTPRIFRQTQTPPRIGDDGELLEHAGYFRGECRVVGFAPRRTVVRCPHRLRIPRRPFAVDARGRQAHELDVGRAVGFLTDQQIEDDAAVDQHRLAVTRQRFARRQEHTVRGAARWRRGLGACDHA